MNEKDNEILELTELLEEDFEGMEGVQDFAPEAAFDAEELDSELDQMLHEDGQNSARDEDINLDTLFDEEEEEILDLEEEDLAVQETMDEEPNILELADEDEQEPVPAPETARTKIVEPTTVEQEEQALLLNLSQKTTLDDLPKQQPKTDEPASKRAEQLEKAMSPAAEEKITPELPEPTGKNTKGQADANELVADLRQEIAELQKTVNTLQAELGELHSGLKEKIQTQIQASSPKTADTGLNQKLQEQCSGLENQLQQFKTDFTTQLQQLETRPIDNREQENLQKRLAALEAGAEEKIDIEALRSDLQDFISQKIPATVASMLREEIAALAKQLGN